MIRFLLFLGACAWLFIFCGCGCQTVAPKPTLPTAEIHGESEMDLWVCGYLTDYDKKTLNLKCAPLEAWLEAFTDARNAHAPEHSL